MGPRSAFGGPETGHDGMGMNGRPGGGPGPVDRACGRCADGGVVDFSLRSAGWTGSSTVPTDFSSRTCGSGVGLGVCNWACDDDFGVCGS